MNAPRFKRLFRLEHQTDPRRDIEDELEFHLTRRAEELVAQGVAPHLARQEALRAFGDVDAVSREIYGIDRVRLARRRRLDALGGWIGDVRVAVRSLRRAPDFTVTALLTLALGLGATTAVFSIVNAVLIRTLPYPDPARLVHVQELNSRGVAVNWAGANFDEIRNRSRTLERAAYYRGGPTAVTGADEPRRVAAYAVSGDFFDVLGVPPATGRTFRGAERVAGGPPAVVVSHEFWRSALSGDPEFEDRLLHIWGTAHPVVGVMPPGFGFPADAELWYATADDTPSRTAHNWRGLARLAPGVTAGEARAELDALMGDIKAREGSGSDAVGVYLRELHDELAADSRTSLLLLQGAVGLVLLLTCVNLANANLARAEHRHREVAVRAALGAGRGRLVRMLLVENLLLALAGGALGLGLAALLVGWASASMHAALPQFAELSLDLRVLGFTAAAAIMTGVGIGAFPAWGAARVDLRRVIGTGGRTTGATGARARGALVAIEFALAFAVLVPAGLLVRSMQALFSVDPGFQAERVLAAAIQLPPQIYPDTTAIAAFYDQVLPRLGAIPGVEHAALASTAPMDVRNLGTSFSIDGAEPAERSAGYRVVSPGYLATMGIALMRGRDLEPADAPGAPHAVLVNESAARRYWPGGDAIGRRVSFPGMDRHAHEPMTIVGVVGDVRSVGLDSAPAPEMFVSYRQRPERADIATLLVRGAIAPDLLATAVRGVLRAEAPDVPVELRTMAAVVDGTLAPRRFTTMVFATFGFLSLALAAVGVYGVLAYSVAQRRRELALRLALGAEPRRLRRMVVGDGLRAVLPGLVLGAAAAFALTRLMRALIVGVGAGDPLTYLIVGVLLVAAAVLASIIPARRATSADPLAALRSE